MRPCVVCRAASRLGRVCDDCRAAHARVTRRERGPRREREPNLVPVDSFLSWLDQWSTDTGVSHGKLAARAGDHVDRALRRWRRDRRRGSLRLMDALAVAAGHPGLLRALYGEDAS